MVKVSRTKGYFPGFNLYFLCHFYDDYFRYCKQSFKTILYNKPKIGNSCYREVQLQLQAASSAKVNPNNIQIQYEMPNKQISLWLLLPLLLLLAGAQEPPLNGALLLDSPKLLSLKAGQPSTLAITLPKGREESFDLFLRAAPTVADPLQVPLLTISATAYEQHCFTAASEFAGVCRVRSADLLAQPKLNVTLRCLVPCELQVEAYLGAVVRLESGDSIDLTAHGDALSEVVHIEAPQGNDTLAVMAVILNPEESIYAGEEGVDLLVNVGAEAQDPDEQAFQIRGSSLNGGGKGTFLYRDKLPPGELIRCLVKLKKGVSVRFSVSPLRGNQFQIDLGHAYYDYALPSDSKEYSLALGSALSDEQTLELVFDVYSGRPEFTLSFSPTFAPVIDFPQTSSANSILLSPEVRRRYNGSEQLFIRVAARQTAEYYFYTQVVREDVSYLQPYLTYFDEVASGAVSNYLLFERYRFEGEPEYSPRNFSFKVEVAAGNGSFHFKRCPALERRPADNPALGDCLLSSAAELSTEAFLSAEIQNRHVQSGSLLTIYMAYDVSQCTTTQQAGNFTHVLCAFQVIALGQSPEPFAFSLLPERKYLSNYLREGKLVKEYIPRDNYAYFALTLNDLPAVEQVNVFMTALSGEAALIVSTVDALPSLSSPGAAQSGAKCNIVLEGEQLAREVYIAVYAYRFTEVNLGVVVRRKNGSGSVHEIPLEEGNTQSYLLNKTQPEAQFIIAVREQKEVTVLINELSGHVRMGVFDQAKKAVPCVNEPQDRLVCSFKPERYSNYSVKVEGEAGSPESKFSITYKSQKSSCFSGSLNHPIFVSLPAAASACYVFALNREVDLSLALALSHLQAMDHQISAEILLNDRSYASVTAAHTALTLADLIEVCPMGVKLSGFPNTCRVSVSFENRADAGKHFSFILEEQDADIALFDGVNERVQGRSAEVGKNFYYHVGSERLIQIFFSTQSLKSHYFLAAHFVPNTDFLARGQPDNTDVYLPYVPARERPLQKIDERQNYYTALLGKTGLEAVSIGAEAIRQYCPNADCYLLLSVYREEYENSIESDADFYEVEVTQEETVLLLGESKVGTVGKGEVYAYLVSPEDAIVEFSLLDTAGRRAVCLQAEAALANGTVLRRNELAMDLQVRQSEGVERIYVKGLEDGCSFSVSYLSNDVPFRIARLSQPYELDLQGKEVARFIYYHENPRTFKLANLLSAGAATAYILPIRNATFTLASLPKINFRTYPFVTSFDGEFTMPETDPNFCSRCYYYVLVTTESRFVGQVVFLRLYDPVPLSTNHVFKERLVPLTALGVENYLYHAMASFNLTLHLLSGKVAVAVVDPEGRTAVSEEITGKHTYELKAIDYREKEKIQFYSERTRYRIRVSAIEEADFYIQVTRQHLTERLFEGLPASLLLSGTQTQTVEFINSQDLAKPLNLMIDIEEGEEPVLLTFALRGERGDGSAVASEPLLRKMTKSDNTYILDLQNFEGRYFIDVRSNLNVSSTFLLVRSALTHLSPKQNYLFDAPAVYQVYSNFKKVVIEVFNCQGELSLVGSKDERDMEQDFAGESPIAIRRPNYAGHYVFATEMPFASYYIMIRNKQPAEPLEYLINYYYYEDVNPYDAVDAASYDIAAEYDAEGGLRLTVSPPGLLSYRKNANMTVEIEVIEITYTAYVSADRRDLNRRSRCLIEGQVVEKTAQTVPSITLEKGLLSKIDAGNTTTLFATVQASIKIAVRHPDAVVVQNSPSVLSLLYNTLEMAPGEVTVTTTIVETSYAYWFTDSLALFVGWMALPFVLAATTLYYLLKYCLRRLMMRQASMVDEIEIVPSNQTVPTEQKIAAENAPLPDTGSQMIKEQI